MTIYIPFGYKHKYRLVFSDTHYKFARKKPTISIYDEINNCETKIASFNSQETFEWFIDVLSNSNVITEE